MGSKVTEANVGSKVILSANGKTYLFKATKPGPLFQMAQIDGGDESYWVPLEMLSRVPLFELQGRPVYAGDDLWYNNARSVMATIIRRNDARPTTSDIEIDCHENPHGYGSGYVGVNELSWEPRRRTQDSVSEEPANTTLYAVVTHSVPSGKKFFASECFTSVDKAKALKKPSNFVGIYKMEKLE